MLIETSRRARRSAVERIRQSIIEVDRIVFKDVQQDVPAESAFSIVQEGRTYVLAFNDPSMPEDPDELERDCGD